MPIKLNGATNGSVELDVPDAVGSDLQLTLPATAGTALVAPGSTSITVPSVNGTLDRLEREGNILQVVQGTTTSVTSNTTSTYADTGLSATIDVSSSSNAVYVIVFTGQIIKNAVDSQWDGRVLRGASEVFTFSSFNDGATANAQASGLTPIFKDNPNATGSFTYKVQFRARSGIGTMTSNANGTSVMFLCEVKE